MPTVDLERISAQLFVDSNIVARLVKDYDLSRFPTSPEDLRLSLLQRFGQTPLSSNVFPGVSNGDVFRAAARALGSNSRAWSVFLRRASELQSLLFEFDPGATMEALTTGRLTSDRIKACLPGQTASADATALVEWAKLLVQSREYAAHLQRLRRSVVNREVEPCCVMPLVAIVLGRGPRRGPLAAVPPPEGLATWKVPGMGPVLASEFLRNLRWSGFKPDRHVVRLFGRWFPELVQSTRPRAQELATLAGSRAREVRDFLTFSLVGAAVTPADVAYTEVDNLVWTLGAYVERKGRESTIEYW